MSEIITTLKRVYLLGREMHPGFSKNSIKHQLILMWQAILSHSEIRNWLEVTDNPMLARALLRFPLISGAVYWPYINHIWSRKMKLAVIDQHYRMLSSQTAIISHATVGEIEVANLHEEYAGLRLVLDKASWFLREGEIVLNLFIHDQRFYSIAFTLGKEGDTPLIYVGALQGSNVDSAQEVYRDLTHALYGMRPRDLLMTALKYMCNELGVQMIFAVSSENRQHNSPYFGNSHKEKVLVAYDEVWAEHGGKRLENGFFEIPTSIRRKTMEEIPSRKRASYKRRYQMLDGLELQIRNSCNHHAMHA